MRYLISLVRRMKLPLALAFALAAALPALSGTALAHGKLTVGDYDLEIGFRVEPAVAGQPNGLDLTVTNTKTGKPVTGLEKTLQVEIIHGASRRTLRLYPQETDGQYSADVLPAVDGDYTWHIFGTLESTPVDVSMTSGANTFDPVVAPGDLAFPAAPPSAAQALAEAQTSLAVGIGGVVVGLIGVVIGLLALRAAHRRSPGAGS